MCGSQEGILNIFTWGDFGDVSDRFPGHPNSIDTMAFIDDDTIATGSMDGIIRFRTARGLSDRGSLVQIHPNQLLGVIGQHEDFPIECIHINGQRTLMASCSHDSTVKFWDVKELFEKDEAEEMEVSEGAQ